MLITTSPTKNNASFMRSWPLTQDIQVRFGLVYAYQSPRFGRSCAFFLASHCDALGNYRPIQDKEKIERYVMSIRRGRYTTPATPSRLATIKYSMKMLQTQSSRLTSLSLAIWFLRIEWRPRKKIAGGQSFYATCEVLEPWVLRQVSLSSRIFLRDLAVRRTTVVKTYAMRAKRK